MCLAGIEVEIRSIPEAKMPASKTPVPAPLTAAEPRTIKLIPPQVSENPAPPAIPALGKPRLA
jgi:hypothetical protein